MDVQDRDIIFKALVGSHAYGTNVEGSDYDYKGVYIATKKEVLTGTFPEQIMTSKDETYYEVSRFLELLAVGNPTMIELLFTPEGCVIEGDDIFDLILEHRDKFLTKKLANSFCGYAYAQIEKAKGLNKKMNWEKERMVRKSPIDFCYLVMNGCQDTYKLTDYADNDWRSDWKDHLGVTKANHVADGYFLYRKEDCLSFYPMVSENGNSLKRSSVKKHVRPIAFVYFNKSEYARHCKEYKEYETWLKESNVQRYIDVENHGQKIDGKNMLHCIRLIDMGLEIAQGKGCNVKRENAEYLKSIRHGKVNLNDLLEYATKKLDHVKETFKNSNLPDKVDKKFIQDLLYKIRLNRLNAH